MSENRLSYLNRNYNDYKNSIVEITKQYYPDLFANLNDASIGNWLISMMADIGDNLNYHIDKVAQEIHVDSATEYKSLLNMARNAGVKVPYKKAAIVEVEVSCRLPLYKQGVSGDGDLKADESYAPIIKRGTLFSGGTSVFELMEDIDFKTQFDSDGNANRQVIPYRDSNGRITHYVYKKLALATASRMKIMKNIIHSSDIKPFMEVTLSDTDVIGVDSIIVKEGSSIVTDPLTNEFYVDEEKYFDSAGRVVRRFFEVDNLIDQYRFGHVVDMNGDGTPLGKVEISGSDLSVKNYYNPTWYAGDAIEIETTDKGGKKTKKSVALKLVAKGKWKRLKNKFITEYDDNWNLKIIFGAGIENQYGEIPADAKEFTKYQMSRMMANDYMGVLPKAGSTMYILYRIGGGEISNIAKGALTNILALNMEIGGNCDDAENESKKYAVKNSLKVTNTTPSYGGRNEPSAEELKWLIKRNVSSQNRCVTLKDYQAKLYDLPSKYGVPFRTSVIEENNKVVIYALGLDHEGHLNNFLSETVAENVKEYLSKYRTINDFVEIRSGKVINISVAVTMYVDKAYDKADVTRRVIDKVYDYMDIRKHLMGEDIFLGDLQKEISKLDGVVNLTKFRVFNNVGVGYSEDATTQRLTREDTCHAPEDDGFVQHIDNEIDLEASDYMLFNESNSMYEIKYKEKDIQVTVKVRD